ncbi:MAG: tetratricopeptide repeat protein [Candidatus Sericytochromatia bacterium]
MSDPQLLQAHRYLESHRISEAQAIFASLAQEQPSLGDAWNGLGLCTELKGQLQQAENHYRQAIQHSPAEPEFYNNLAICLQQQGKLPAAKEVFEKLLTLKPDAYSAYNLALIEIHLGQHWQALDRLGAILEDHPAWDMPQIQIDHVLTLLHSHPDTLAQLRTRLAQAPGSGIWNLALGLFFEKQHETDLSLRYYRAALRCAPHFSEAYRTLGSLLQKQGQYQHSLELAWRLHQLEASPRSLTQVISGLQEPIPLSVEAIRLLRQEIERLIDAYLEDLAPVHQGELSRPESMNFYHFYQGYADRTLQEKLFRFYSSHLPPLQMPPRSRRQRARVGIVSIHLHDHSVTHLLQRALQTVLSSEAFESWCFFLLSPPHNREDQVTDELKAASDHFVYLHSDFRKASLQIAQAELDVLIYPDVGMDPFTYTLAQYRLAPCQMVLPGHPVTTGIKNMDFFISGEGLDPEGGEADFSESLIRLPGLPDYARPQLPPPASRRELQMPEGPLYFCPMTLFKVHPDFDVALQAILDEDPSAQIALLQFKNQLHLRLLKRFQTTLPRGLERVHFIPWGPRETFYQRLQSADVILDTFYFGGGNTSYQALGLGCPIVTLDCAWNKGRWTQALYAQMGLHGLVAADPKEYVALALRLAHDKAWNESWRQAIQARNGVCFDNPRWSEGLLDFCQTQVMPSKRVS